MGNNRKKKKKPVENKAKKERIKIRKIYIVDVSIIFFCVLLDRLSKMYAYLKLKSHPSKSVINGIMEFTYLENPGASFGLLKGEKYFFILVGVVLLVAITYLFAKMPQKKKFTKMHIVLSFIAGGALGNLFDRFLYDYVIDFIYFSVIHFPIFNVADIFITIASVVFIIFILFVFKEEDLNFLRFNEKKLREL